MKESGNKPQDSENDSEDENKSDDNLRAAIVRFRIPEDNPTDPYTHFNFNFFL